MILERILQDVNSPYISFEQYFQEYVLSITDNHILQEMQALYNRSYKIEDIDKMISSMQKELVDDFEHRHSTVIQ